MAGILTSSFADGFWSLMGSGLRAARRVRTASASACVPTEELTLNVFSVNAEGYKDQTDVFYESPLKYIRARFPPSVDPRFPASPNPFTVPGQPPPERYDWKHEWPQYLVMFGVLLDDQEISNCLEEKGYRKVWHEERGWEGDRRRQGGVTVLKVS